MRRKAPRRADRQIYTRTASHTKRINLGDKIYRGGTRL